MNASLGIKLGRGIGYTAAAVAHGAAVTVRATGQFGADVVTGTTDGYVEHSERFASLRAAALQGAPMTTPIVPKRAIKVAVKA
jgi:hypothetical protein